MTNDIYKDGDENIPDCVKDRNGSVALGLCKKCGKAECELNDPCLNDFAGWKEVQKTIKASPLIQSLLGSSK